MMLNYTPNQLKSEHYFNEKLSIIKSKTQKYICRKKRDKN